MQIVFDRSNEHRHGLWVCGREYGSTGEDTCHVKLIKFHHRYLNLHAEHILE
jgi:hypothetical protein